MGLIISTVTTALSWIFPGISVEKSKYEIDDGITLFNAGPSPCARRVRMFLLRKKLKWKAVEINLGEGEQRNPEYLKINPNGKVPALAVRGIQGVPDCCVYESNVITEFLDSYFPTLRLYPDDPWELAQVRMWQDWELSLVDDYVPFVYQNILALSNRIQYKTKEALEASIDSNVLPTWREKIIRAYEGKWKTPQQLQRHGIASYKNLYQLEEALEGKKYLVGNRLTAADISVFPRVMMFNTAGLYIREDAFPNVKRFLNHLNSQSFVATSDDMLSKVLRLVMRYAPSLPIAIGRWRSGQCHQLIDNRNLANRALAEIHTQTPAVKTSDNTGDTGLIVYDYPVAAECWQMKLLLAEKNTEFTCVSCDMAELVGRPFGSRGIYRIHHVKRQITGPRAVLEYIDTVLPGKALLPRDPLVRAQVQCWQSWEQTLNMEIWNIVEMDVISKQLVTRYPSIHDIMALEKDPKYVDKVDDILQCYVNGLAEDVRLSLVPERYVHFITDNERMNTVRRDSMSVLSGKLRYLEEQLQDKDYLVGDDVTLADICVFCRIGIIKALCEDDFDDKYPNIAHWLQQLKARKNFKRISNNISAVLRI